MVDAEAPELEGVIVHLRDSPEFLAGWLAATPAVDDLLAGLRLDRSAQQRLLLCRAPRPEHFATDVTAIADYVGVEALALAQVLRAATALTALATRPVAEVAGELVAAARDSVEEQPPGSAAAARLRTLAEATWSAAPAQAQEAADVEAAVAWSSPVAVVSLPRLALPAVNRWLDQRGIPRIDGGDDPLRGLIVAWRGHGVIFIDGTLSVAERRFTIAHEHGHFLLDYLEPRHRVLADAPDLLAMVDGQRPPTSADRARAALARVPLGVHRHLLARDAGGGATVEVLGAEDDASGYALELLAPWDGVIRLVGNLDRQPYEVMLSAAANAVSDVFALPMDVARARAAAALEALGIREGFFDR